MLEFRALQIINFKFKIPLQLISYIVFGIFFFCVLLQ